MKEDLIFALYEHFNRLATFAENCPDVQMQINLSFAMGNIAKILIGNMGME